MTSHSDLARRAVRRGRDVRRRAALAGAVARSRVGSGADLALFHEFVAPPGGGGHQFLRALVQELDARGLRIELNRISRSTRTVLVNSYNFDAARLARLVRDDVRVVHRVDGPITVYRGTDDGTDRRIWELNRRYAHATVFQSQYSLERHRELGLDCVEPVVIHNAVDPRLFHPTERGVPEGRIRVITTAWSDNLNKGAADLAALERALDWERYEITFVGRTPIPFERIRTIPPQTTEVVAELLRGHDVFLAPSRHESCSNALLEALSCGLPVLYVDSGSNGELVGEGGLPYASADELPAQLDRLASEWEVRRRSIEAPALSSVAAAYCRTLGLDG